MAAVLTQTDRAPAVTPYIATTVIALLLAGLLTILVLIVPSLSTWDASLSQQIQSLRRPEIDRWVLSLTLAADFFVSAGIIAVIAVTLAILRQWWLALYLACVFLSARLLVSLLKGLLMRSRPGLEDGLLSAYSFPSGHTCTAVILFGTIALVLASELSRRKQFLIYTLAAILAVSLGLSRIYLLAHWPSDVLAGLAIGLALLVPFAWQLALNPIGVSPKFKTVLILVSAAIYGGYWWFSLPEQVFRYAI